MQIAPLIQRCSDAYWTETTDTPMQSLDRMQAVLKVIADEIESYLPDKEKAPVCYWQAKEIALKIRIESIAHFDPKRKDDFIA